MKTPLGGLHHVTAIATDPATNLAFYRDLLGLRLVKKTVNFDDPGTYHLYFGNGDGAPGTILTFFPWPGARRGSRGAGQAVTTSFVVPAGAIGWWRRRFQEEGVSSEDPQTDGERSRLVFYDPDGLRLDLVGRPDGEQLPAWDGGSVPLEAAIRGFAGVTLSERALESTSRLLTEVMGYRLTEEGAGRVVLALPGGALGSELEIVEAEGHGQVAAGTVHHVAFRVADAESQLAWRQELVSRGLAVSEVKDRNYFHSIYFREPGGVLFELATDPPGFTADESPDELGSQLKLPPFLEAQRKSIETALPPLEAPAGAAR